MITTLVNHKKDTLPNFNLSVRRVETKTFYTMGFYKHHYMSQNINLGAKSFIFFMNDTPIAFVALLNAPSRGRRFDMSISRLVILPDFQGLGLTKRIMHFLGGCVKSLGSDYRLTIKTSHIKMGHFLTNSTEWKPLSTNLKKTAGYDPNYSNRKSKACYCYYYDGDIVNGYEDLFKSVNELRKIHQVSCF